MDIIEVAIIEDKMEYRNALKVMINGTPGFSCRYAYANGKSAIEGIQKYQPDIIMVDLGLPDISGIECIRQLKEIYHNLQFLVLTISEQDDDVFMALKVGASGYLLKDTTPAKILECIKELYDGGAPMSAQIARKVVSHFQKPLKKRKPSFEKLLTRREQEVLELLSRGMLYKEIATELNIAIATVKTHCRNIYEKLHVNTRTEALLKYFRKEYDDEN